RRRRDGQGDHEQHAHERRLRLHLRPEGADGRGRHPGIEDLEDRQVRAALPAVRVLLALALLLGAASVRAGEAADANLDILRDTIRANKKALVAANLTLSDDEAKQFWPLYDRYQSDLKSVNDRAVAVIKDYTTHYSDMTDEHAMQIADQYLGVEQD